MAEKLDWDKPIVFANGEPCKLIDTIVPPQCTQFGPEITRVVWRIGVDSRAAMWCYKEDGSSNWPGYQIVNQPENTTTEDS